MLGAALLYALCVVMGKELVLLTDPVYSTVVFWGLSIPCILGFLAALGKLRLSAFTARPGRALAVALVMAGHFFTHMYVVSLTKVAYMVAIKRLSGLLSVLYGKLLFDEPDMRNRLAGSAVMSLGAAILALYG